MTINPFIAGILATLLVEAVTIIIAATIANNKKHNGGNH